MTWCLLLGIPAGCGDDEGSADRNDATADAGDGGPTIDAPGFDLAPDVGSDASDDLPDPSTCVDDGVSSFTRPKELPGTSSSADLILCPGEDDWFGVALGPGDHLEATLSSDAADIDLDLSVWSESRRILARSESPGNDESVALVADQDEVVRLRIYSVDPSPGAYRLEVVVESFQDGCDGDAEEPNDTAGAALPVSLPYALESRVCFQDTDWFSVALPAGATLAARLDLDHDQGDLDMYLRDPDALEPPLAASESALDWEGTAVGPFGSPQTVLVEIVGYRGAVNIYALELTLLEGEVMDLDVSGQVSYEDRPFDREGFTGDIVARPARGAAVELVRDFDGAVLATAIADPEGHYSLSAGVYPELAHYVRALASTGWEGLSVRVEDRTDANHLYGLTGTPFVPTAGGTQEVDLLATADSPLGGAFNIADTCYTAFTFLGPRFDPVEATVSYRWEPGRAYGCRSCYGDGVISLGGSVEDADEYDDDIVLHELGHFFQDIWDADDSPGGTHNGEQLHPLLAWGEGSATYLSSWVQGDADYVDLYIDSLRLRDLEVADEDEAFYGTDGGDLSDDVSEYLVAAILWDATDAASEAEPFDAVEMTANQMSWLLSEYLASDALDQGVGGIDLADWLNGAACSYPETNAGIASLCTEDRQYPWDPEADAACQKAAEPSAALLSASHGRLWLTPTDPSAPPARLRLYLDEGAGFTRTELACSGGPCALPVGPRPGLVAVVTGEWGAGRVLTSWSGPAARAAWLGPSRVGRSPRGTVREVWAGARYASTRFLPRFLAR